MLTQAALTCRTQVHQHPSVYWGASKLVGHSREGYADSHDWLQMLHLLQLWTHLHHDQLCLEVIAPS